jgi:hypothetical protein
MRPRITNVNPQAPSSKNGHLIASSTVPRAGSVSSVSNKTPPLLMLSVLPDPVRSTRPLRISWYRSSKVIGYRPLER